MSLPATEGLYEDAACGLLLTAEDGTMLRVNRTFCRWVGRSDVELLGGLSLQSLLTMGGKIFHQTHWSPLLQLQGSVSEVKLDLVHSDGHRVPFVMNAQRRRSEGNTVHEIAVFIAEDRHKYELELVAARKRTEQLLIESRASAEALREAERQLQGAMAELSMRHLEARDRARFAEQMMGIVSHDLRSPLGVVRTSGVLLGMPALSEAERPRVLQRMARAVQSADKLIDDLLDFTAARMGRGLSMQAVPIALHALVAQVVDDLRQAHPGSQMVHVPSGDAPCAADPARIAQLLRNLVINAVTYDDAAQPIEVTSSTQPDLATLAVANHGPPIPETLMTSLFEPMTQGSGSSAHRSVGLGLYIVSEIARAHGGAVSATSTVDAGTRFVVQLLQA